MTWDTLERWGINSSYLPTNLHRPTEVLRRGCDMEDFPSPKHLAVIGRQSD